MTDGGRAMGRVADAVVASLMMAWAPEPTPTLRACLECSLVLFVRCETDLVETEDFNGLKMGQRALCALVINPIDTASTQKSNKRS